MKALDFRVIMHDVQAHPQAGWENIIAGKSSGFCGFLRLNLSQNIVAITGNVRLYRFTLFYVLIDRFSQLLRCEVVLHFINTWDMKYSLSRNFYVRTCVKFAFANKIKAMYERPHVQLCKRKSRNSLNLTFNLNTLCLTSIWLSTLTCHGCVYTGSFELD